MMDDNDDVDAEREPSELEKEFKSAYQAHIQEINAELALANEHLRKAEELSEKYGLPFESSISPISQTFCPDSYEEKFPGLDSEVLYDIAEVYDVEYSGWQHSAVC